MNLSFSISSWISQCTKFFGLRVHLVLSQFQSSFSRWLMSFWGVLYWTAFIYVLFWHLSNSISLCVSIKKGHSVKLITLFFLFLLNLLSLLLHLVVEMFEILDHSLIINLQYYHHFSHITPEFTILITLSYLISQVNFSSPPLPTPKLIISIEFSSHFSNYAYLPTTKVFWNRALLL